MGIFNFTKKEQILASAPKTSITKNLENEFNEIDSNKAIQTKIKETIVEKDISNNVEHKEESNLLNLGSPVINEKINKPIENKPIENKSLNNEPKKEEKVNLEVTVPPVEIKKPEKKDDKEKVLSIIATLAMTRPASVSFDLEDDRFIDEGYEVVKFDISGTDEDLLKIINENPNIKYLDISDCANITNFSILSRLTKLKHLDISGNKIIKDINFLSNLTELTILNIAITGITSLESLSYFPNLKVLNLKMNKIKSLKGLEKCPKLHDLILWGTDVENIDILSNFTELRALDFDNCFALKDFSPISKLYNLMFLELSYIKITNLSFLKELTNIESLVIDTTIGMISESSLVNLDNLTKMKLLCIRNVTLRDLSHLRNMTQLMYLDISGNAITDLRPLENMTEMEILILSNNLALTDLSPLHKMSKLLKLKMNGVGDFKTRGEGDYKDNTKVFSANMTISDFSFLKYLPNLEVLESNNNSKIKDISPIINCKKILEAHFKNCISLSDITPLRFCKSLEELHFDNDTQIKDFSFLKYLTNLKEVSLTSTNIDPLIISNLTNLLNFGIWGFGNGSHPLYNPNVTSTKYRRTMTKILKKAIKK